MPRAARSTSACAKASTDNQEWAFVPFRVGAENRQVYQIRNIDDNLCMDVPGNGVVAAGTAVSELGCSTTDNQGFWLEQKLVAGGLEYYWIRNTPSGLCLEVTAGGGSGARLKLAKCTSGDDHEWALVQKPEW